MSPAPNACPGSCLCGTRVFPQNPARAAFVRQVAKVDLPRSDYTGIGLTSGLGYSVDEAAGSRAGCAGIKDTPVHPAPPLGSIH